MTKKTGLMIINPILGVAFLMSASGGLIKNFFPDAIPYEMFQIVHPMAGIVLTVAVIIHIWLNWTWVKTSFFPAKKKPKAT